MEKEVIPVLEASPGDLRSLGLPTLPEDKDEFNRLVDELGVRS